MKEIYRDSNGVMMCKVRLQDIQPLVQFAIKVANEKAAFSNEAETALLAWKGDVQN